MKRARVFASAMLIAAPFRLVSSQDAMFRGGPAHAGVYAGAGLPAYSGLQWRAQTGGPVRSTPTVAGMSIYVGSGDGNLYAFDSKTGDVKWRAPFGAPITSSAAVSNGLVFVNGDGAFRAYHTADGKPAWTFKTAAPVALMWGFESGQVYASSPAVANGHVVFGSVDGVVYSLDPTTGHEQWRYRAGARVYSSPAIANGTVIVGSQDGVIHAIDLANGKAKWHFDTEGKKLQSADFGFDRTTVQSSPAIANGVVFIGARDGFLYALDAATGAQRWRFDHKVSWVNTSPAVSDGLVYAASSDGHFIQAVDAATGAERWRVSTTVIVWTSPTVDADRVYINDDGGVILALDKKTGTEIWRCRLGRNGFSSPVVADGHLYVGSDDGAVYALNGVEGQSLHRAVYWDSAYTNAPLSTNNVRLRAYLTQQGYEDLDAAKLARFMTDRIRDRAPSVVVFAIDFLPASVAPVAADTVLFRRYLNAGGTVVWTGAPPGIAPLKFTGLKELDRSAPQKLIGVRFTRGNFDQLGVSRISAAARRLGFPDWYLDSWGADAEDVTTAYAFDEQGQAAAWVKRYGGPVGTGFIRVFAPDGREHPTFMTVIQTAAEMRPR
ncbi:MAG TPA: PQQ-binding-like beta-propeller repeat protein [Gemmatimonadaceae bacterium]|nr:PQQ-binding-like beta-propeller repeat protein [Gemmatimonadaceae bacterium]